MIVSKTPFRMSFVGGGSDIPSYYTQEEGAVISTSINKYMYVAINKKFDGNIRLSYSTTEEVMKSSQLRHPIARHALNLLNISGGVEISSMADIPSQGSGLGSSSSYAVGLLNALYAYRGEYISKNKLGELASHIEIDLCGEPIGKQDQYAAAFGGLNLIKFHSDDSVTVEPVVCAPSTTRKLEDSIIAFYTGRTRSASSILKEQSNNMLSQEKRILMRNMVRLVYDLKEILEIGDVESVGPLLDESWRLKTQLASGVTDPEIDTWYRTGINSGATGGKLLGAGNGGFLIFFAPKDRHKNIANALGNLREVDLLFEQNGSQIVFYR